MTGIVRDDVETAAVWKKKLSFAIQINRGNFHQSTLTM